MATEPPSSPRTGERLSAIGDRGELWLASRLPQGWIWQPPRKDVGKDGLVVIRDDSDLHNLEFAIQIKTTTKPRISHGAVIVNKVSRSSILYWFASTHPTLVIVVDISEESAWYAWHFDLFNSPSDLPADSRHAIDIRIPVVNKLTAEAWKDIRAELERCYSYLHNATSKADSYVWIVASTNLVCNAARNLIKASASLVPGRNISEEEGISLLIEQHQHRTILVVARKFLNGLAPDSKLYKDAHTWLTAYEAIVRSVFPALGELPSKINNDFRSELAVRPSALSSSRGELIMMIFDLVALLTQIRPSGSHNAV